MFVLRYCLSAENLGSMEVSDDVIRVGCLYRCFLRWMFEWTVLGGLRIVPYDIFVRALLVSKFYQ